MNQISISSMVKFCRTILAFLAILFSVKCKEPPGDTLKGHLQPIFSFGERKTVNFYDGFPRPVNFFRDFVWQGKPVLLRNAATTFPAFKKWNEQYFLSFPESKKVQVSVETLKKENRSQASDEVLFSEFISNYHKKDVYMVDSIPPHLRQDVMIPSCLNCRNVIKENMISVMMWMSSGGTKSVLHNDHAENINCVFKGTKTFFLVDRKYMDKLNVTELGYSDVDVERVDIGRYPGLYNIEHYKVVMQPGDCLYIPFLWVHQVTSHDDNIAVNFWWKENVDVNFEQCDPTTRLTVNDVNFVGFEKLYDAQYSMIRGRFLRKIRQNGPMTFEDLVTVIRKEVAEIDDMDTDPKIHHKIRQDSKKVFGLLDSFPADGIITKDDVDHISKKDLETIRKYVTGIVRLQQERIEQMEELEEGLDQVQDKLDQFDTAPEAMKGKVVNPNQSPQDVQWNADSNSPDLVEKGNRLPMKKKLKNSESNMKKMGLQWEEMVRERKLKLERQDEL